MSLPTLYARKITADETIKAHGPPFNLTFTARKNDVALFLDRAGKKFVAIVPGHFTNKPTKRHRYYTLNCVRWRLLWVPEKKTA